MADLDVNDPAGELARALETAGAIESWLDQRLNDTNYRQRLPEVFRQATRRLLGDSPTSTDQWEHLLFATAARSAQSPNERSCEACNAAISELIQMIEEDHFSTTAPAQIVTLASALTIALSAQRKLRQPVEMAMRALHDRFPEFVPLMAEQCQNIWQLHGQMSGLVGPYVWDTRNDAWRLNQDFKPHRPK